MKNKVYLLKNDLFVSYFKDKECSILHREGAPAIEWLAGSEEWYLNGKRHRIGGPAIYWVNGSKKWYVNGKIHREDGPAIEFSSGDKEYYFNNIFYKEITSDKSWFEFIRTLILF